MRYIHPDGPLDSTIIGIGESPWTSENAAGKPFAGPSGNLLNGWLMQTGLSRSRLLVNNVWPIYDGRKPSTLSIEERTHWITQLHKWIATLPNPRVLVPMGNLACYALLGKGGDIKGIPENKKVGITSLRGGIYPFTDLNGRILKVIPILHPAHILRGGSGLENRSLRDWRRVAFESTFPEIKASLRHYDIEPNEKDLNRLLQAAFDPSTILNIDLENERTGKHSVICVGFSFDFSRSYTLPLTNKTQITHYLPWIAAICSSPCPKILQYGFHDAYLLKRHFNIDINNYLYDLGAMHHAIHPRESHNVAFLASWYLPYYKFWKDEGEIDLDESEYTSRTEAVLTYNGMDNCNQRELFDCIFADLYTRGALQFYFQHYQRLFDPLLNMMYNGILVDKNILTQRRTKTEEELLTLKNRMTEVAGENIWCKKKFSRTGMLKLFHEKLQLPQIVTKKKNKEGEYNDSVSLNATTMMKYAQKYERAREPAQIVIQVEHLSKELSTWYNESKLDPDNRVRCKYGLTTDAGRLNSSENPLGTGYNLQNVKRPIRDMYLPDYPDWIFIKPDLSSAEDRVVKMWAAQGIEEIKGFSGARMVHLANRKPWEADAHKEAATFAFGCRIEDVTKDKRQTAKVVSHGSQRGMSGQKLADKLLLDHNLIYNAPQCQKMIDAYLEALWEIRDGYFPFIRQLLIRQKCLINNWGRVWRLEGTMLDADTYRQGYSFNPQSDVRDLMSQWGIIPLVSYLKDKRARINADMHDGLLISSPPEEAYDISAFITEQLERPRFYFGKPLIIPVTITISRTWKGGTEFSPLPDRTEFNNAITALWST